MVNCQAVAMFSAYVSPLGRDLVDKRLYLRERWTSEIGRCSVVGVPEERRGYRSKTELALDIPERAWSAGKSSGRLGGSGDAVCQGCSTNSAVWPLETAWTNRPTRAGDNNPKLVDGQHRTTADRSD